MSTAYQNAVLADGPIAFWPLQTDGQDIVGARNLTIDGEVTFETDASALVPQFARFRHWNEGEPWNGSTCSVSSAGLQFGPALTYECWAQIPTAWGGAGVEDGAQLMALNDRAGIRRDGGSASRMGFSLRSSTATNIGVGGWGLAANIVPDQFAHIAMTYDRATLTQRVYVNGVLESEFEPTLDLDAATNVTQPFSIGYQHNTDGSKRRYFKGRIAFAAVYDVALTPTQVLMHYEALTSADGGPVEIMGSGAASNAQQSATGNGLRAIQGGGVGAAPAQTASGSAATTGQTDGSGAGTNAAQIGGGNGLRMVGGTGASLTSPQTSGGAGIRAVSLSGDGVASTQTASGTAAPSSTGSGEGIAASQAGSGAGLRLVGGAGDGINTAQTGAGVGDSEAGNTSIDGSGAGAQAAHMGAGAGLRIVGGTGSGLNAGQMADGTGKKAVFGAGAVVVSAQIASGTTANLSQRRRSSPSGSSNSGTVSASARGGTLSASINGGTLSPSIRTGT